ncbi:hypothetical protein [Streptomyces albireticuli]|uniref:Secreted protein n=1 Tax=Streptomyces albireticuli TaxID=1940 RepID=A0A2A2D0P5_9ACTN|nr:hypothetical protein [Streptomyces albireticuli]MCD9145697.1 hypothetical protein [Streptomyces albireticuli]MCD9165571.1 hypothetical protein [Streptomyces albireticuli]MCD9195906.1 hypothetical protein [Streptomyces albireticuli]PAU45085.1 hypothetical protein CK936_31395 [Streptomyces albireticuli]
MKARGIPVVVLALLAAVGPAVPAAAASAGVPAGASAGVAGVPDAAALAGCSAIGGGKYNCRVWKTAPSYECTTTDQTDSCTGRPVGRLNAGTNYFFCQTWGGYYSDGRYYNHYWGMTDDDSGHRRVWVPVVYISGGDNDGPVPGLPRCP